MLYGKPNKIPVFVSMDVSAWLTITHTHSLFSFSICRTFSIRDSIFVVKFCLG